MKKPKIDFTLQCSRIVRWINKPGQPPAVTVVTTRISAFNHDS